jgi:DNA replication protein DnaC
MGIGKELKQIFDELMPQSAQEKTSENFESVYLDDAEVEQAILKAKEEKYYRLKREAYNEKIRAEFVPKKLTFAELINAFGRQFSIDDENILIIQNLCYYFSEDDRFDGDPKKGLLLVGGVGIGKTTLMQFFKQNQKASYRVLSCREIESDFSAEGEKSVQYCSYNIKIATNANPFGHQEIGFCFDDLGTEANGKHFGKEKNVMAEIILNRYDNQIAFPCTHITTNLSADKIREQYGTRVTDRMREMFNIITFDKNAKSRRK